MSMPPEDAVNETSPIEGEMAGFSSGSSSSSGSPSASSSGSTSASSSGSSSGSGEVSGRSSSDSRRVAPKWLGKKIGRFRLQGLLGQGAAGRVFRAEDAILHRRVALKVITLHGDNGQINRHADQFLTEARAAAALEHPNVVQIYEAGESGNLCYIAMELLDGGSLKDLVVAAGPMDPGRACLLTADAADALAAGHEAGIIHRDIKPANLMLSRQGRCKVTDFGLATFGDAESVSTEKAAGTPLFAAPEVIRGTSADERSDIYSLGATLYYLLTGRPPFTAKTRAEVLKKHVNEPIPDLRVVRPGLPESLVAAVEKALDKDPGQRYGSATQFARVLRVQTIPAAPLPPMALSAGETIGGASVLNLSGMTAVSGSSAHLTVMAGGGPATAADLASGGRRPVPAVRSPQVVHDSTPPQAGRHWWATPAGIAGLAAGAVLLLICLFAVFAHGPQKVVGNPAAVVPVVPIPPVPALQPQLQAPVQPGTPPVPTLPPPVAAGAPLVPATDGDRLNRIASGTDPDHPDRRATVAGTVDSAELSPTGKVFRLSFASSKLLVVYFDTDDLFHRMSETFGGENGSALSGKAIHVTGPVKMYHNAPEIIVTAPSQVTVVK